MVLYDIVLLNLLEDDGLFTFLLLPISSSLIAQRIGLIISRLEANRSSKGIFRPSKYGDSDMLGA